MALASLLALGCTATWGEQLQERSKELDQVREQIEAVEADQQQNRQQRELLETRLLHLEKRINQLGADMAELLRQHHSQQQKIGHLSAELEQQQKELGGHRQLLFQLARRAYLNGQNEQLKLLLNQQDPARLQRMLTYYRHVQQANAREIDQLQQLISAMVDTQRSLEKAQTLSGQQLVAIEQSRDRLQQQRVTQSELMGQLAARYQGNETRLRKLRADESRLSELLRQLQSRLDDIPEFESHSFASRKGRLPWPVEGQIAHRFGHARGDTGLRWNGVLLSAASGSDVHAVHGGRVAYADWLRGFGLLIILDHGDDYMTVYGHNQMLLAEVGDWVGAGEVIAQSGDGGAGGETGLYFEVRRGGTPSNPAKWCD